MKVVDNRAYILWKGKRREIPLSQIIQVTSMGQYCKFHLEDGEQIITTANLRKAHSFLPVFWRIHWTKLVNPQHIRTWVRRSGLLVLSNGEKCRIADGRLPAFREQHRLWKPNPNTYLRA
ncbi:hypothetical protein GCM10023189_40530 [Nibrella saemangeumensis]|uniref:HTH LytTR-type domain-containing protein n=1 Tax=Nibrella saemangeumensis TaxID=1084526 RepID=A0ABP8NB65_9BACT